MIYNNIVKGVFRYRENRFVGYADINGEEAVIHIKNTGRCKELLIPGTEVYLQEFDSSHRKTKYDLITVRKGKRLINIDSQAPNKVFYEFLLTGKLFDGITLIKPEATYGNSRFDFYIEAGKRRIFAEVKGVTLEESGVALFPDAPTERGVKHLHHLSNCLEEGYEAFVVFVIQMKGIKYFSPNIKTHPQFGEALVKARSKGVNVLAIDCKVKNDSITTDKYVEIRI